MRAAELSWPSSPIAGIIACRAYLSRSLSFSIVSHKPVDPNPLPHARFHPTHRPHTLGHSYRSKHHLGNAHASVMVKARLLLFANYCDFAAIITINSAGCGNRYPCFKASPERGRIWASYPGSSSSPLGLPLLFPVVGILAGQWRLQYLSPRHLRCVRRQARSLHGSDVGI